MNAKEIIDKIKQLFAEGDPAPVPPVDPPAPVVPLTHTLKDGRILSVTALEVGQDAVIDGAPAPAGDYELEDGQMIVVGDDGKIAEVKAAPIPDPAPVPQNPMTEEQMRQFAEGFATGTPEERLDKSETIIRALMEYCFGWELREVNQKALKDQAIAVYKAGFEAQEKESEKKIGELEEKLKGYEAKFEKQGEIMTQMFDLVQELAKVPQDDAPEGQHRKSSFAKSESAKTQKERFFDKIAKITQK